MKWLKRTPLYLLLTITTALGTTLKAQVKFYATISPGTIGREENAELKFTVENAPGPVKITPPSLSNFDIISGPNQETGMEIINGNTRQYTGVSYLLHPKTKGNFTIGAATIVAGGKQLKSNPVTLKVVNDATGNGANLSSPFSSMMSMADPEPEINYNEFVLKKGENVQEKISKNLFIKVFADKSSCYVGEPVVVTYKLYTRVKSESNIVKSPSFNGFSVIDLQPMQASMNYTHDKLDGRDYNVYTLRKVQLYPLQAGTAELETAAVENNVHFVKAEYLKSAATDIFGDFIPGSLPPEAMVVEKVTVQSKPLTIQVKPLPDAGKPASFNGAVGNFKLDDIAEKDTLTTDDAGSLKILLSGEGNLPLVPAPEIAWPAGMEGYEPTVKDGYNKLSVPVSGSKIFDYPFSMVKEGTYTIPAVEFSYFDPSAQQYKTVFTKPLTILVNKGTGKRPAIAAKEIKGARESFFEMLFTNRWMIIVPVALLIIGGLLVWLRRDNKKAAAVAKTTEPAQQVIVETLPPKDPLEASQAALLRSDPAQFYETLNRELHAHLSEALHIRPELLTRKSIIDALDREAISIGDSLALQQLLDAVAGQLYMPYADETKMQDHLLEAMRLVKVIAVKS